MHIYKREIHKQLKLTVSQLPVLEIRNNPRKKKIFLVLFFKAKITQRYYMSISQVLKSRVTNLPELRNILASCLTKQRPILKNMKNVSFFFLLSTEEKSVSNPDPGLDPDPGMPKLSPIKENIKNLHVRRSLQSWRLLLKFFLF